ncbi:MAG: GH3 auxin-responsive promoter family protein [Anaerolineae bacterium]|nr:GH3 auxin-responsive promoter family protein [Anaerolineae bacterium]
MNNPLQNMLGMGLTIKARQAYQHFTESSRQAQAINDQLLTTLLSQNRETEYGRRYRFAAIRSVEEFKTALPLTVYDDYQPDIDRMADGDRQVLTSETIRYFSLSSGTTGKQKLIPITPKSIRVAAANMGWLTRGILQHHLANVWHNGRGLNLMNLAVAGRSRSGIPRSAGTAGGMRSMKPIIPLMWTSPVEMLMSGEGIDAPYLHLRFALMEETLAYICAPFVSPILDLFRRLEQDWRLLVEDVAQGSINVAVEMPSEIRTALRRKLRPAPLRAAALAAECERGFDGIARRIWPQLLYVEGAAGGSFSMYAERLKTYTNPLPIYSGCYAASEGLIGISRYLEQPSYVLIPEAAYFEFIPLSAIEQEQPETLSLSRLTIGESYEVVLTSFAGLYRYRLADVVRVTGYYQDSPEIEFLYRRNQLLNLVAEKTSEHAAQHAIQATFNHPSCQVVDFSVMADLDVSPGRYVFFVELGGDDWQWGRQAHMELDRELGLANPSYASARRSGKISPLDLRIVQPGTFAGLKTLLLDRGASPNQLKIPRVVRDDELIRYLADCVLPTPLAILST